MKALNKSSSPSVPKEQRSIREGLREMRLEAKKWKLVNSFFFFDGQVMDPAMLGICCLCVGSVKDGGGSCRQ